MGMFSWKCSCCDEPINAGTVASVIIPPKFVKTYENHARNNTNSFRQGADYYGDIRDGALREENYVGYGIFGNRDIYSLVAYWNGKIHIRESFSPCDKVTRIDGINIACYDSQNASLEYPIKIVCGRCDRNLDKKWDYDSLDAAKSDPNQGFNEGSYETQEEIDEREEEEANTCWDCGVDLRYEDCDEDCGQW